MSKVLDYVCAGKSVILIRAGSDLLIMLLYFWNSETAEIATLSEPTKKNEGIIRSISRIAENVSDIRKYVTFAHSFSGCDTTLAITRLDKVCLLRLLEKSAYARSLFAQAVLNIT